MTDDTGTVLQVPFLEALGSLRPKLPYMLNGTRAYMTCFITLLTRTDTQNELEELLP